MKKCIFLILILSVTTFASEFSVKTLKGNAQYQKNGKGDWVKVTKAIKFEKADMIKLESGAQISLVHSTGNPLELSKSGKYSIAKLAAKANTKKSDVTKKFTNYLMDELGDSDDMLADADLEDNMTTLGAVERAIPKFSPNAVNVGLPRSSYSLENSVDFSWYQFKDVNTYKFVIKDDLEEVVFEQNVEGTNLTFDFSTIELMTGSCYYWSIEADGNKSEEFCINIMAEEDKAEFEAELSTIVADIDTETGLGNMILASYYNQKKLIAKAMNAYSKAIELSPENDNYKLIYGKFLMSNGFSQEAKELASK